MFDELNKYKETGHFFFEPEQRLSAVCNAPANKSGVYVIYELRKGKVNLIYIGCSGRVKKDGTLFIRKAGLGGIKDRIVNGHQFGKAPQRIAWPLQMVKESIDALDIYWYVTHNDDFCDCPRILENNLIKKYDTVFGKPPKWNKKF